MKKYLKPSGILAQIVVMSHLSDAKLDRIHQPKLCDQRIEFAKFVINKLEGDLTLNIDVDLLWEDFIDRYN